jgi:uncharacterized FAD-dependent dehydrogenase
MLVRLDNITINLALEADDPDALRCAVAQQLGIPPADITDLTVLKRSLDTRRAPRVVFSVHAEAPGLRQLPAGVRPAETAPIARPRTVPKNRRDTPVAIIGAGPAGLFAAWSLATAGLRPVLLEQGKPVETRAQDVSRLMHWGQLQQSSNLCYGEGGAGTWSDGKLTTRIGAGATRRVLRTLVSMGAPERILTDGKPHLGTNRLVALLKQFRGALADAGTTIRFGARVDGLTRSPAGSLRGIVLADGEHIDAKHAVLATGHSSRMIYELLLAEGVALEPKAFAVGFRVEHPQALINQMQYGQFHEHELLPAADYRITASLEVSGQRRGVYSFCMCPGGQIVPTPTEPDGVVVNGMSHAARSGRYANSALVVTVDPGDFPSRDVLGGVALQNAAERRAGALGGGLFRAPAQSVPAWMGNWTDSELRKSSYTPGVTPANLRDCYPAFVTEALTGALRQWARRMPAFVSEEAMLVGVETRTSAPVRVLRDATTLQSVTLPGLHPCGEGAGYGGGIVSAAVDGLKVADAILDRLGATV